MATGQAPKAATICEMIQSRQLLEPESSPLPTLVTKKPAHIWPLWHTKLYTRARSNAFAVGSGRVITFLRIDHGT